MTVRAEATLHLNCLVLSHCRKEVEALEGKCLCPSVHPSAGKASCLCCSGSGSVVELKARYTQRAAELEQAVHQKLRQQQKIYEEAFKEDVKHYLSTGHLQHRGDGTTKYRS